MPSLPAEQLPFPQTALCGRNISRNKLQVVGRLAGAFAGPSLSGPCLPRLSHYKSEGDKNPSAKEFKNK